MNPEKLEKGKRYKYVPGYGKSMEIFKCLDFSVSNLNYNARFEVLTDSYKCNRIGKIENFNHIEIERYIEEI